MAQDYPYDNSVAIVVSTFDAYHPCWDPFCHGISKYWPDCPFQIYFITNYLTAPCGHEIKIGPDQGWSMNLQILLSRIPEEYILYMQEDYWLDQLVDTGEIISYVNILKLDLADHIRLYPSPPAFTHFSMDGRLGIIGLNDEYRVSLQMGIWRKSVFQELISKVSDGWSLERLGSTLSAKYGTRFLSVKRPYGVSYTFTAVVDGEWSEAAYFYAHHENIHVDFAALPKRRQSLRTIVRKYLYRKLKRPLSRALGRPSFLR